ncbi:hypothetical protein Y1Q_0011328 [Alligator mississippiensis]|uniref:Uncharacterized protein n=1 Tax=Alligator mississippiensis TaxID=8496 RepID=A0A151N874_ALLMI|nr:hypothetical protein Y1Q_0011328 [Alligator mississippiensis]
MHIQVYQVAPLLMFGFGFLSISGPAKRSGVVRKQNAKQSLRGKKGTLISASRRCKGPLQQGAGISKEISERY